MAFLTETLRGTSTLTRLGDALEAVIDAWSRYRVFRSTYDELSALSTRELDDLGISRSMITRLAYEAAYGKNA